MFRHEHERLRSLAPDIVFLQEVQGLHLGHAESHGDWPSEPQYEFLAQNVWHSAAYGQNMAYDHGHHGNAILSRMRELTAAAGPVAERSVIFAEESVRLAGLIARVADNTVNHKTAKEVFVALWRREADSADAIIEARGLKQITDSSAIEALIDEVLAANPGPVAEYRAGKEKAFNSLVGQAMKATKGKANPQQVNELLKLKLQQH